MAHIIVKIRIPDPETTKKAISTPSLEEKVKTALELIDSGYNSATEWLMINKFYNELKTKKETPRIVNLIKMIEPVMSKYGQHGVGK